MLELLVKIQDGHTSVIRALEIIEQGTVPTEVMTKLHQQALEVCYAVEALPASRQQTELSLKTSRLTQDIQQLVSH